MMIDWYPREEYVELLDEPAIQEYIAKYSYVAAVSIMMRGAFANMLKAFLDVNPPIDDYVSLIKSTKSLNRNAEISGIVKAK